MAQDYFPQTLTQKETLVPAGTLNVDQIPDLVSQIGPELSSQTFFCPVEQKPFKFQSNEIKFYKKVGVALPRLSFEARYRTRNQLIPFPY